MRKLSLVSLAAVVLLMCSLPAFAGQVNEIVLSGSCSGKNCSYPVSFTGTGGGNFTVNFNINNLSAFGDNNGIFAGFSGFYSIMNAGAITSSGSCGTGCFGLSGSSSFHITDTSAGDALDGILSLVSISQTPGNGGIFNDNLVVNLTVTGGYLQPQFIGNNGIVQLTIAFKSGQNLMNILKNQKFTAAVISGAVFPVPEPGSLTLLGAGLLGFAGLCRKKLFA